MPVTCKGEYWDRINKSIFKPETQINVLVRYRHLTAQAILAPFYIGM